MANFPANGWPNLGVFSLPQGESSLKISAHQVKFFGGVKEQTNTKTPSAVEEGYKLPLYALYGTFEMIYRANAFLQCMPSFHQNNR